MDPREQALQWAQANPNDPIAQKVIAKDWALKNPDDPIAKQVMQKLSSPSYNPISGHTTPPIQPSIADQAMDLAKKGYQVPSIPGVSEQGKGQMQAASTQGPADAMEQAGLQGIMNAPKTAAGKLLSSPAVQGGLAGFLKKPEDDTMENRVVNAAAGSIVGSSLGAAGKALGTAADFGIQKAVGLKKYLQGSGTKLLDEGIVGTKSMMKNQVADKIVEHGKALEDAVDEIKGNVSSREPAQRVSDLTSQYETSGGRVSSQSGSDLNLARESAQNIAQQGDMPSSEALALRKQAYNQAYKDQNLRSSTSGQISKAEGTGYSQALKDAYAKEHPDLPNKVAEADAKLSSLYPANKSLNQPETIRQGVPLTVGLAGSIGAAVGGAPGAATAAGLAYAARQPLVQSVAAQIASKTGKALPKLAAPLAREASE